MKPTDSKPKSNNRKRADYRKKAETWQTPDLPVAPAPELPDLPAISRLRRVVDMSALQPTRPQKSDAQKPTKSKEGAKQQRTSRSTVHDKAQDKTRVASEEQAPKRRTTQRKRQHDPATSAQTHSSAPSQALTEQENIIPIENTLIEAQPSAEAPLENTNYPPAPSTEAPILQDSQPNTATVSASANAQVAPKTRKKPQLTPRQKKPSKPRATAEASKTPSETPETQENASSQSPIISGDQFKNVKVIEASARKVRTAKAIKSKLHLSEKRTTARKERAIKAPRLLSRQIKRDTEPKRAEHSDIMESILESLLLESWRARQWSMNIAALEPGMDLLLQKSMPMVQARFVNNICIDGGRLEATVVDQIASIGLRQFTPGQWRAVINGLSDRAIFTTSLLNGELPEGILEIFKQASLSLFPTKLKEFEFSCDCGAEQVPCEHVCALLLTFAQALEEDPFHILTLRGMPRDNLLAFMRDARSDQVVDEKTRHRINYELPAQNVDFDTFCTPKGNFNELAFHISYETNNLVRRLGNPSQWHGPMSLDAAVHPIIELAARAAENLSLGEQYTIPVSEAESRALHAPQTTSRAPRSTSRTPRFKMPDMSFVLTALSPEILETVPEDPVATAEDIIRWLKTRGACDIRTLARRTRLHKPTIEAFLNAFCDMGLTQQEGEEDKIRFVAIF